MTTQADLAHWRYRVQSLQCDADRGWIGADEEVLWLLEEAKYNCELAELGTSRRTRR